MPDKGRTAIGMHRMPDAQEMVSTGLSESVAGLRLVTHEGSAAPDSENDGVVLFTGRPPGSRSGSGPMTRQVRL